MVTESSKYIKFVEVRIDETMRSETEIFNILEKVGQEFWNSDQGKWVNEHAEDIKTTTLYDPVSFQRLYRIIGRLYGKNLTWYILKYNSAQLST